MTGAERTALRHAIDQARRERLQAEARAGQPVCAGCGCDHDTRSIGCRTCANRHLRWKWRSSPEYRERERVRYQERRRRRRAREAAAA